MTKFPRSEMTEHAIIHGTYADYRRVKGRKVLQLVIEVPIEQAPEVHTFFGEPSPDGTTWVAVALLDPNAASVPSTAPEKPKGGRLAQQAGIVCGEGAFRKFLADEYRHDLAVAEGDVAAAVRSLCEVSSRREIDTNPDAAAAWRELHGQYIAWMNAP